MKRIILSIALIAVYFTEQSQACECGKASTTPFIVGGKAVTTHKYPWMVSLIDAQRKFQFCGGSLINSRWVVTAAHCTHNKRGSDILIGLGSLDWRQPAVLVAGKRVIQHPGYVDPSQNPQSKYHDDLALIELSQDVPFNDKISPICLSTPQQSFKQVTASGWGLTLFKGQPSTQLLEVDLEIKDDLCTQIFPPNHMHFRKQYQTCASLPNKDVCNGDSGGPLMGRSQGQTYIVGAVSWGVQCGDHTRPAVYTRIAGYYDWIRQQVNSGSWCEKGSKPNPAPGPGPSPVPTPFPVPSPDQTRNCRSIHGPHMDEWCVINCQYGFCPQNICVC